MKTTILIASFLFFNSHIFAQNYPDFNDTINIQGTSTFFSVFPTDSCYYTVGDDGNAYFAKFDLSGNLSKIVYQNYNLSGTFRHNFSNVVQFNSEFALFSSLTDSSNHKYGFIAIVDNQLNTIWTKEYHYDLTQQVYKNNYFTDIQKTPDGGYIVSGFNQNYPDGPNHAIPFLMKVNNQGVQQWYKEYSELVYINKFELTPDLGILLYASEYNKQSIVKTTALGNIVWKKYIKWREIWGGVSNLEYAGGDDYVVVRAKTYGKQTSTSNMYSGVNLIKINHITGQFVFDTIYRPYHDFPALGSFNLNILNDGKIVVSGTARSYKPASIAYGEWCSRAAIVVFSPYGDSLWAKTHNIGYIGAREDHLADLKITPDGGFVGCGEHVELTFKNSCYSRPWIFKITPSWATSIASQEVNATTVKSYPNPTNDYIIFRFSNKTSQKLTLVIYNMLGKEVLSQEILKGATQENININNLGSGVYLYQFIDDEQVQFSGKILKQ